MGILEKHAKANFFDVRWPNFEELLDRGEIRTTEIPGYFLIRTRCENCDEEATAIKYHGRRILIVPNGNYWQNHQCPVLTCHTCDAPLGFQIGEDEGHDEPTPEEEIDWQERADIEQELLTQTHPDDPCSRDGSGNIRSGGWHDEYPDDPYSYPDIPYVDPTQT